MPSPYDEDDDALTRPITRQLSARDLLAYATRTGDIPRLPVRRCPECDRPVAGKPGQLTTWHLGPVRWWHRLLRLVPTDCRGVGLYAVEG